MGEGYRRRVQEKSIGENTGRGCRRRHRRAGDGRRKQMGQNSQGALATEPKTHEL